MADETPTTGAGTPDVGSTPVQLSREPADDFHAFVDELRWTPVLEKPEVAAYAAAVVLCQLERRLTGEEKRGELNMNLPVELRILLAGCPIVEGAPPQRADARTFLADIGDRLETEPTSTLQIVSAVFTALRDRLPEEEVHWVANQLPPDVADLWRRPI